MAESADDKGFCDTCGDNASCLRLGACRKLSATPRLVTGRSDKGIAEDLRRRITEAMQPLLAIMDEATEAGLACNWQLGPDWRKKTVITSLAIWRPL